MNFTTCTYNIITVRSRDKATEIVVELSTTVNLVAVQAIDKWGAAADVSYSRSCRLTYACFINGPNCAYAVSHTCTAICPSGCANGGTCVHPNTCDCNTAPGYKGTVCSVGM